jgi:hypothetical protein
MSRVMSHACSNLHVKCCLYEVTIIVMCLLCVLHTLYTLYTKLCLCKGKAITLQAWRGLRFPGARCSQISRQSAHEGGKVSHTHGPPLPPRNIPGTHFC